MISAVCPEGATSPGRTMRSAFPARMHASSASRSCSASGRSVMMIRAPCMRRREMDRTIRSTSYSSAGGASSMIAQSRAPERRCVPSRLASRVRRAAAASASMPPSSTHAVSYGLMRQAIAAASCVLPMPGSAQRAMISSSAAYPASAPSMNARSTPRHRVPRGSARAPRLRRVLNLPSSISASIHESQTAGDPRRGIGGMWSKP